MKRRRFTEVQVEYALRQAEAGKDEKGVALPLLLRIRFFNLPFDKMLRLDVYSSFSEGVC